MAKIVLGIATSHSPQLSTPVDLWNLHAERDRDNKELHYRGKVYDFAGLQKERAGENLGSYISDEQWLAAYEACERGIAAARQKLAEVKPDILVVIGDDQRELFLDDNMPTFAVFWGERVECVPRPIETIKQSLRAASWANYGTKREFFPTVPDLGKHIVETMMQEEFDVAQLTQQTKDRSIGHAFTFTRTRIMEGDNLIPMVPIMINTYFPPNQPTPGRCYAFGKALRKAIESWDSDKTVAIIASGGLTHFVVDEELDRQILKGLEERDEALLSNIPMNELHSGTSESRNWITAGGAMEHLKMKLVDYIPAYRTSAGTGCGMAFAWWE
jgi:3-O-methylgallate 3,4-dioxygenase